MSGACRLRGARTAQRDAAAPHRKSRLYLAIQLNTVAARLLEAIASMRIAQWHDGDRYLSRHLLCSLAQRQEGPMRPMDCPDPARRAMGPDAALHPKPIVWWSVRGATGALRVLAIEK